MAAQCPVIWIPAGDTQVLNATPISLLKVQVWPAEQSQPGDQCECACAFLLESPTQNESRHKAQPKWPAEGATTIPPTPLHKDPLSPACWLKLACGFRSVYYLCALFSSVGFRFRCLELEHERVPQAPTVPSYHLTTHSSSSWVPTCKASPAQCQLCAP